MTKLNSLSKARAAAGGDVVFVHGLGGDPLTTWRFDVDDSWSRWLAADRPDLNLWSLGYEVEPTAWTGSAMPLTDRAINVLAVLDGAGLGRRPVCFIAHSMGGLLVKQLLRHASTLAKEYQHICNLTRGIIFFSTPHTGSSVASLVSYLQFFVRATVAVRELEAHEPRLRELNLWYRNNVADLNIATRVFYETRETRGMLVVNATSADPGLPAVTPIPVDSNHFDICCPGARDDLRYVQTVRFLNDRLPIASATVPQPLPDRLSPLRQRLLSAQSPPEIQRLLYETEQLLAEFPHDPETKQFRDEISMALRYEYEGASEGASSVPRTGSTKGRWSPITPLIPIIGSGVLLYGIYKLIAWLTGW